MTDLRRMREDFTEVTVGSLVLQLRSFDLAVSVVMTAVTWLTDARRSCAAGDGTAAALIVEQALLGLSHIMH